jgi:hypothetical protein
MPNKEFLVNNRINHGIICSGMLPSHYTKFVDGAGIGKINKEKCNKFFKSYDRHIQQEYDKSTETALLEESASYYDEKFGEIYILTDARHVGGKTRTIPVLLRLEKKPTKFCHVSM